MHVDHPYFVALQAHPEFCTRPLNPSPPFLGFVAAAAASYVTTSPSVLDQQMEIQLKSYVPPHPEHAMVGEAELREETGTETPVLGKEVAMAKDQ